MNRFLKTFLIFICAVLFVSAGFVVHAVKAVVPGIEPAAPVPVAKPVKLMFLGDMMLDRVVAQTIKKQGFQLMMKSFRDGADFDSQDLVVANLEGNFAKKRIAIKKELAFRFDPALAPELKWLGIDAVSLANNHALDMGTKGFADTRVALKDAGVLYFGTPVTANSESFYTVTIPDIQQNIRGHEYSVTSLNGGKRVALVGFNLTFGALPDKDVKATMKAARDSADIVVVVMHWGAEYKAKHSKSQEDFAKLLIDNGADAVIGSHPHVIEDIGEYKNKPIFYSLGNFMFDQDWSKATQRGMAVKLEISDLGITHSERYFKIKKGEPTWE